MEEIYNFKIHFILQVLNLLGILGHNFRINYVFTISLMKPFQVRFYSLFAYKLIVNFKLYLE